MRMHNLALPLLRAILDAPLRAILLIGLVAALAGWYATDLRVDTDLANLLPEGHPSVVALNELKETVGGETPLQVAIKSPNFDQNVTFADDFIEQVSQLQDPRNGQNLISRVDFRRDTKVLENNFLYVATENELQKLLDMLDEEIQQAKEEANPFFIDFGDELDDSPDDSPQDNQSTDNRSQDNRSTDQVEELEDFQELYDQLIPSEYPTNEDSTLLLLELYPTVSKSDINGLETLFISVDTLIEQLLSNPDYATLEVQSGGRLKRHLNELESVTSDVIRSFASGISAVIVLVMLYFFNKTLSARRRSGLGGKSAGTRSFSVLIQLLRSPVAVLIIGGPLVLSLLMTFGLAHLFLETLNTMTAVLFVILFGLGIDYGIHFYARYIELRSTGTLTKEAIIQTFSTTGGAITASALTTAFALFILIIADFRGFSEFGLISGIGILFALLMMMFFLPAFLMVFERLGWVFTTSSLADDRVGQQRTITRSDRLGRPSWVAMSTLVAGTLIAVIVLSQSSNLRFEYDFGTLEPEFPEYRAFRTFASGVDEDRRRNPAYILASSHDDVFAIVDSLRSRRQANPESMIGDVEALSERFPHNKAAEERKLSLISEVRQRLQDPFLRDRQDENLDLLRQGSQTTEALQDDELPDFLKTRFMTQEGELGKFVIVYPASSIADGRKSIAFKDEIGEVGLPEGRTYYAASTSIVAAQMLDLMREESPKMVIATFILVFIFMSISLRSPLWATIAALPLLVGLLFLFGWMLLFDIQFNFYNLVVLPAILGIGCDNGIHVVSRYREEGRGSLRWVLRSTGQHITIGSFTTMMGFGGLLFTLHPGLQSIGILAFLGVGMALFVALTYLPALLSVLESQRWFVERFNLSNTPP
ncbi:MAG: MMPL family transporter [Balneolaceae bacterium]|nr:MMPL family transporter [Balneolaceae bacterium]